MKGGKTLREAFHFRAKDAVAIQQHKHGLEVLSYVGPDPCPLIV
jgi:hypothetical protein